MRCVVRRVRRVAIGLLFLVVLAGESAHEAVAAHPRHRALCHRFRCETVASNANVSIVKLTGRPRFSEYLSHVAVWKPSGRITRLGDSAAFFDGASLGRFALAGSYVGLSTDTGNHETGEVSFSVSRVEARSGRREIVSQGTSLALLRQGCLPGGEPPADISALVVAETGAMAWISVQLGVFVSYPGVKVCELPPRSQIPVVLSDNLTIVRDSLAFAGHTLYWTQEGKPVSAPLN
jgi:hypothetical protein